MFHSNTSKSSINTDFNNIMMPPFSHKICSKKKFLVSDMFREREHDRYTAVREETTDTRCTKTLLAVLQLQPFWLASRT